MRLRTGACLNLSHIPFSLGSGMHQSLPTPKINEDATVSSTRSGTSLITKPLTDAAAIDSAIFTVHPYPPLTTLIMILVLN
jgi:hypothetical protein